MPFDQTRDDSNSMRHQFSKSDESTEQQNSFREEKKEQQSNPSRISSVSDLGKVRDTKEVIDGHTVTLETLTVGEQDKVLAGLPDSLPNFQRFHRMRILTLTYATREYNGQKIRTDKDREGMYDFYYSLQDKLLSKFYTFYLDLVEEQNDVIDELKKK